jgi:hypothetical protein
MKQFLPSEVKMCCTGHFSQERGSFSAMYLEIAYKWGDFVGIQDESLIKGRRCTSDPPLPR